MQARLEKERYEVVVVWAWVADQRNLWGADGETVHSYGFEDIPARGSDDERMLGYLFGEYWWARSFFCQRDGFKDPCVQGSCCESNDVRLVRVPYALV